MRNTHSGLKRAFDRALRAVLATSGPLVIVGCGDSIEPGIEDDPGFVPMSCTGGTQQFLPDLTPGVVTEYIELRRMGLNLTDAATVVETRGSRCGGAADLAACEAGFAALDSANAFRFGFCQDMVCEAQLAATQGDAALLVDSRGRLAEFLFPIDAPAEAMLILQASGIDVACDRGGAKPAGGGFDVQGFTRPGCDGRTRHVQHVDTSGTINAIDSTVEVEPDPNCAVGRRPAGLCPPAPRSGRLRVGDYWARAARLEAASVHAFRRLARELALHGAPKSLSDAALSAARDEIRHARVVSRLARELGATVEAVRIEPVPLRDLESVALENAAEGCVRETFGALVSHWQGRFARTRSVRVACSRIARDELRHAALAWRIEAWTETRLSHAARARVRAARHAAVTGLRDELAWEPSRELVEGAGLPDAGRARALAEHVRRSIWH